MPGKDAKKGAARPRRSKTETQQAFAEIQEELDASPSSDAKTAEANLLREAEVRRVVDGVTVENVIHKISGLGLEVSRALAAISEKISQEVELLANVREAVALERKELQLLHKIDVAATALDQLVRDYADQKQKLENEILTQRGTWEEETENLARERKEHEEALKKQRQRENEDYEYKKNLERKKAQDKYEEELRVRDKRNQEQQETLEKGWQRREAAIKEREEEIARLLKESQEFPVRLSNEIDVATEKGRKQAEAKLEQQIIVLKKDAETDKRLAQLQVKTLEEALARNSTQIAALEKQLADAKQQVQDIAVKAIEGASGARALSHINQIAMEQAKNRPQG
jgi:hypothetical protein